MPIQKLCTVAEAVRLNEFACSLTLEAEGMEPQGPDQFVHVKCGHSRLLRRPISICDWGKNRLRIVFEVRGEGTEWLARRKAGDTLDVLGPLGCGFQVEREARCLLVGGGIGVPPMLGCAVHGGSECTAILGFRSAANVMLLEEFNRACSGGVRLATDDGSLGHHGFVDALVRQELEKDNNFTAVLACGPKPMLKSVYRAAAEFSVSCQVSMEERMGCGVGACLVCACKMADGTMKHACKDGPVFDGREVDWDE